MRLLVVVLLVGLLGLEAYAYQGKSPLVPISKDFTLANGLRVILAEDHTRPTAAIVLTYDVGSRHEVPGKSGFAHLFEHMMFEGSQNISKAQMSSYLDTIGGEVNASTATDYTIYYASIPSNMLERLLWIESDRMRALNVTESNFLNQLATVEEEKRSSYDNKPYMPAYLKLQEVMYSKWANKHSVIGSFHDLESSTVADAKKFFTKHYAPNHACLAIAGDFNSEAAEALVRKYFSTIPKAAGKAAPVQMEAIPGVGSTLSIVDKYAELPGLFVGFKSPGMRESDYYAIGVIEKLLLEGKSSRLYQRLVKRDQIAIDVENYSEERRGPANFVMFITLKQDAKFKPVENAIFQEIGKLKSGQITFGELQKAKNQLLSDLYSGGSFSLQTSLGRAALLSQYALFFGNSQLIDDDIQKYLAVSVSDIQRVARRIFPTNAATIIEVKAASKN